MLLVFLVLAALYESLTLPLAVILIVPMSILAALTGVYLTGNDNNIFTQIGLMVLVGLSAKNAILIVEFARELEMNGRTPLEAAIEALSLIHISSPGRTRCKPLTTMRSPAARPESTTRRPSWLAPSLTRR